MIAAGLKGMAQFSRTIYDSPKPGSTNEDHRATIMLSFVRIDFNNIPYFFGSTKPSSISSYPKYLVHILNMDFSGNAEHLRRRLQWGGQ
jgi:hypothetical protein